MNHSKRTHDINYAAWDNTVAGFEKLLLSADPTRVTISDMEYQYTDIDPNDDMAILCKACGCKSIQKANAARHLSSHVGSDCNSWVCVKD